MLGLLGLSAANKDLIKAIDSNNPSMVNVALKSGAKPDFIGPDGDSALIRAIRFDKHKAAKALLKAGAGTDKGLMDKDGLSAMHVAAAAGAFRTLQLLITEAFSMDEIHAEDGLAPLHRAVLGGERTLPHRCLDSLP